MKRLVSALVAVLMLAVVLPCTVTADIPEYSDLVVVAFGDSITAAGRWQSELQSSYGIKIINAGVGGDSTNSAKSRFKSDVLDKNPDLVFISFGTNDAAIDMAKYVPLESYKSNIGYFIDECQKIGAKVIINIPPPVVDSVYLTRHEAEPFEPYGGPNGLVSVYAEAAREVARAHGVLFADHNAYFSALPDFESYFPDGVHPSNLGYKYYAYTIAPIFEKTWLADVDLDGNVDAVDYLLVKRTCFGTAELSDTALTRADINGNHVVDEVDYLLSKRICFGTYTIQ